MNHRTRIMRYLGWITLFVFMFSFKPIPTEKKSVSPVLPDIHIQPEKKQLLKTPASPETGKTTAGEFTQYAKSLIGIPYKFGSMDPIAGFDCSGFINYVAKHFSIKVPRSSYQFTNLGKEVHVNEASEGDLILFTGTNAANRTVGHIGIVTENIDGNLNFIHSSSGKGRGVMISDMNDYYKTRFVKLIRIFPGKTGV